MLLREQVIAILPKLRRDATVQAFSENSKSLMNGGMDRGTAYALAFAAVNGSTVPSLKAFLKSEELEDAAIYRTYHQPVKEKGMASDPLTELAALDGSKQVMSEQRPAVDAVVKQIEDDLQKAVLVSLARMMREMGYERWPSDPVGREDIKRVIDAVAGEMVKMGRRFSTLTKDQMRVLKNRGPKNYERIVRKWLMGEPDSHQHQSLAKQHHEPDMEPEVSSEPDAKAVAERNFDDAGKEIDAKDQPKHVEGDDKNNPFAICTAQVGRDDAEKYERCVKDVKARYNVK